MALLVPEFLARLPLKQPTDVVLKGIACCVLSGHGRALAEALLPFLGRVVPLLDVGRWIRLARVYESVRWPDFSAQH